MLPLHPRRFYSMLLGKEKGKDVDIWGCKSKKKTWSFSEIGPETTVEFLIQHIRSIFLRGFKKRILNNKNEQHSRWTDFDQPWNGLEATFPVLAVPTDTYKDSQPFASFRMH